MKLNKKDRQVKQRRADRARRVRIGIEENKLEENQYRCNHCGEVFNKGWSEEEAMAEHKENWGDYPIELCRVICDDCYNEFMSWKSNLPKETVEEIEEAIVRARNLVNILKEDK